jgi:hypothetical protein
MPLEFMAKEKGTMVGGGRGGRGNIVHKDQVAPSPAPMRPSLEVETVRDRLTTHGRGGEGNQFWHVLEEGAFMTVILYEQRVVLLKRASEDDGSRSSKSNVLNDNISDRVGSPMSDESSLCHKESTCEDGPMVSESPRRLRFGESLKRALRSPTTLWKHQSTVSPDHSTRLGSAIPANYVDFHIAPGTLIDLPALPVSDALDEEALPLSWLLDIPSSALR